MARSEFPPLEDQRLALETLGRDRLRELTDHFELDIGAPRRISTDARFCGEQRSPSRQSARQL